MPWVRRACESWSWMGVILGGGADEVQPVLSLWLWAFNRRILLSRTRRLRLHSEEGTSFLSWHGKTQRAGWWVQPVGSWWNVAHAGANSSKVLLRIRHFTGNLDTEMPTDVSSFFQDWINSNCSALLHINYAIMMPRLFVCVCGGVVVWKCVRWLVKCDPRCSYKMCPVIFLSSILQYRAQKCLIESRLKLKQTHDEIS